MSIAKFPTEIGGLLGERITVRKVNGRVVITNRPIRRRGAPSAGLKASQEKFQEASRYASGAIADAATRAVYSKGITDKKRTAFLVALTDYLRTPTVTFPDPLDYDGSVGNTILIKAVEDFLVTRVRVSIKDAAGVCIEEGEAAQHLFRANHWTYTTCVANPVRSGTVIQAAAYDRPGNRGTSEIVL